VKADILQSARGEYRLPNLTWLDTSSSTRFQEQLTRYFNEAVEVLIERGISGAKDAMPESVKGENEPGIKPPKKSKRKEEKALVSPLDQFMED